MWNPRQSKKVKHPCGAVQKQPSETDTHTLRAQWRDTQWGRRITKYKHFLVNFGQYTLLQICFNERSTEARADVVYETSWSMHWQIFHSKPVLVWEDGIFCPVLYCPQACEGYNPRSSSTFSNGWSTLQIKQDAGGTGPPTGEWWTKNPTLRGRPWGKCSAPPRGQLTEMQFQNECLAFGIIPDYCITL